MVRFFSQKLGVPYPWNKYAQIAVSDFVFGGMENTTATTQTDLTLHDARAHVDFSSNGLVAHELAHQWFGNLLTCKHWSHAWLNEGFATYFDALFHEHHKGIDETDDGQDQWFTVTVQRPKTGWPGETIDALRTFVNNPGAVLSFRIPIEDRKYLQRHFQANPPIPEPGPDPQVAVSWQSRTGGPAI